MGRRGGGCAPTGHMGIFGRGEGPGADPEEGSCGMPVMRILLLSGRRRRCRSHVCYSAGDSCSRWAMTAGVGGGRPLRACEVTERQPARLLSVRRRPCEVSGRGEANLGQQNGGDDLPLFAAPKEEDRPRKRLHTRRLTRDPRNTGVRATPRPAESPTRGPPFVGAGGGDATAPPPLQQRPATRSLSRAPQPYLLIWASFPL